MSDYLTLETITRQHSARLLAEAAAERLARAAWRDEAGLSYRPHASSSTARVRAGFALARRGWPLVAAIALGVAAAGCAPAASAPPGGSPQTVAQPYAGLQARGIKALHPERLADLLAGNGAGYALAAELNRHPGPRHVLDLAPQLELTAEQEAAVRALVPPMETEA